MRSSSGRLEDLLRAKRMLDSIPKTSTYARDARLQLKTINRRVAENHRLQGISRCRARYYVECYELLCKAFETYPNDEPIDGETSLRRQMKKAKRAIPRSKFKRCKAERFQKQGDDEINAMLAKHYPQPRIRNVVSLYYQGKLTEAEAKLRRLVGDKSMRSHSDRIKAVAAALQIISGRYKSGYSAVQRRDAFAADREWIALLEADRELIPGSFESNYRLEVKRELGQLFFELGQEEFSVARFELAFKTLAARKPSQC